MANIMKRIDDLVENDLVDLEADPFADPNRDHVAFRSGFQIVDAVEHETPHCTAVWFEGFDCVGFPPGHLVRTAAAASSQT